MKTAGWLSYVCSLYFWYRAYDRISNYSNSKLTNAWVGGDAYNYIINGTHASTFALAGLALIAVGSTCFIVGALGELRSPQPNAPSGTSDEQAAEDQSA